MAWFSWFRRKPAPQDTVPSPAPASAQTEDGAEDRAGERGGWLISSVDLQDGLQVMERDEEATIPSELDALAPRREPRRRG